jgi:hypothetical protein
MRSVISNRMKVDELVERYEIVAKQLYRLIQSWQDFTNSKTRAAE